jgi:hypothetical protein
MSGFYNILKYQNVLPFHIYITPICISAQCFSKVSEKKLFVKLHISHTSATCCAIELNRTYKNQSLLKLVLCLIMTLNLQFKIKHNYITIYSDIYHKRGMENVLTRPTASCTIMSDTHQLTYRDLCPDHKRLKLFSFPETNNQETWH